MRFTAARAFTPRLRLGVEYNAVEDEVGLIGSYLLQTEGENRPLITLGTSSDRIFSPPGTQAYFVTAAKGFGRWAPYVGASYSEWEEQVIFPFGVNYAACEEWDALFMNDGRNSHLLLTRKFEQFSVTGLLIKMEYPGISISARF